PSLPYTTLFRSPSKAQESSGPRAAGTFPEWSKTAHRSILPRWRPTFLAARRGSSGGSALGGGFLALLRDIGFVGGRVHQVADPFGVCQSHLDQPPGSVRGVVDRLRFILQLAVGLDDFPRGGGVNLADGLHRLHRAKRFSRFNLGAWLGQFDKNHVAQFVLRVVGDADRGEVSFHLNPLMLFGVAVRLRIRHQTTPCTRNT